MKEVSGRVRRLLAAAGQCQPQQPCGGVAAFFGGVAVSTSFAAPFRLCQSQQQ